MNVLITGASGFLGTYLVAHLRKTRPTWKLTSLGLSAPKDPAVNHFTCDLKDSRTFAEVLRKTPPQIIFHLAGSSKVAEEIGLPVYFENNFLTTVNLLETVEKLDLQGVRIFLASSIHVYGNPESDVDEDGPVTPSGPYGFSKFLAEQALEKFAAKHPEVVAVVGRLSSCVGPKQPPGFVTSDFIQKIKSLKTGEALQTGPLTSYRQFIDVRDAVSLFPDLLEKTEKPYAIFNIATGTPTQIEEVLKALLRISGKTPQVQSRSRDNRNPISGRKVSTHKLKSLFPGFPFRPIEETLKEMWNAASEPA